MSNRWITLPPPTRESGQYVPLLVNTDGLGSIYIQAGADKKGTPRAFELVAASYEITTDATVANRVPYLVFSNQFKLSMGGIKGKQIAASSAGAWTISKGVYLDSNSSSNSSLGIASIEAVIQGEAYINSFWIDGKAGDVVRYQFLFKYLKPEL